jgi:hypothetical protein
MRLIELALPETSGVAILFDSPFDAVFYAWQIVRIPWIVRRHRHN